MSLPHVTRGSLSLLWISSWGWWLDGDLMNCAHSFVLLTYLAYWDWWSEVLQLIFHNLGEQSSKCCFQHLLVSSHAMGENAGWDLVQLLHRAGNPFPFGCWHSLSSWPSAQKVHFGAVISFSFVWVAVTVRHNCSKCCSRASNYIAVIFSSEILLPCWRGRFAARRADGLELVNAPS